MAAPEVAATAKATDTIRAVASMHRATEKRPNVILAVSNAPTALLAIVEELEPGLRPALVIGVSVDFVNAVESKERLLTACGVPAIVAIGRKSGSNVATAICNALVYSTVERLDPAARGRK